MAKTTDGGINIQIDDDWRLGSDKINIVLEYKKVVKSGKNKGDVSWHSDSFHRTIDSALIKYLMIRTNCSDANTAAKLITEWNKTLRSLKKIVSEYNK